MNKQQADNLITEHYQKIYGYAIKKSFSYDEAEELCADIILEVYHSLLKVDEVMNIEGYIWQISENVYSRYVSRKKKLECTSIHDLEIPCSEDFTLEVDAKEEMLRIRREISYLTEVRRNIVYLFYYENRPVSYIAKQMDIPEGTVKWHLNKARNEIKGGFFMERQIGRLGIAPIATIGIGHNGDPGTNGGPEFYLNDKLNLNIVYSVYFTPRTREEIGDELGVSPAFLDDRLTFLEENGFLVKTTGKRYTTYVCFEPETNSLQLADRLYEIRLQVAKTLVEEYVPIVRDAITDVKNVYIPSGNRELFEAAVIFYAVANKCGISIEKDLSKYYVKTTAGGDFYTIVDIPQKLSDPEYEPVHDLTSCWACGSMWRSSEKYPSVVSWSVDSKYCSRKDNWKNNLTSDYEYLYEYI